MHGSHGTLFTLLSCGASVDKQDINGFTPLAVACQEGHLACALSLLQAGASLYRKNNDGVFPIHLAAQKDRSALVILLLEHGCPLELVS